MKKVPVALIFFNRPEPLERTFESIRSYKPDTLFLIQDGVRATKKQTDLEKIEACREVVENIDWECNVIKIYSDKNLGCGFRIYSGVKEAFEHVDRLVIIEDDIICSSSFFTFCEEMLERYKDESHIHLVSGMNPLGAYERCPYSYFFSPGGGSIWGWATWKRVWDTFDYDMTWYEDKYVRESFLSRAVKGRKASEAVAKNFNDMLRNGIKLTAWSASFGCTSHLYYRLNIIPKYNLTSNIGLTGDSVHATSNDNMLAPHVRALFNMKTYDLEQPLVHPKYMFADLDYENEFMNFQMIGNSRQKIKAKIAHYYRILRYGGLSYIVQKLKKRNI